MPDGTTFTGVRGLQEDLLRKNDFFFNALATQLTTYTLGRELDFSDRPAIRSSTVSISKGKDLIKTIVPSESFIIKSTTNPMKSHHCTLLLSSCFLLSASQADAVLLAYEGFNTGPGGYVSTGGYVAGGDALVYGNSGPGTGQAPAAQGFSPNPWALTGNQSANTYAQVQNQQMSYSTGGMTLVTTTGQTSIFREGTIGTSTRSYTRSLNLGITTTFPTSIYMSGMFSFQGAVIPSTMEFQTTYTTDSSNRSFRMDIGGDGTISFTGNGAGASTSTLSPLTVNTTYFFVIKINEGGGTGGRDILSLYLNPVDLTSEAGNSVGATREAYYINPNAYDMHAVRFGSSPNTDQAFIFDELRIGTTWADVVPHEVIPEVSSALMAITAAGTISLRRRRR